MDRKNPRAAVVEELERQGFTPDKEMPTIFWWHGDVRFYVDPSWDGSCNIECAKGPHGYYGLHFGPNAPEPVILAAVLAAVAAQQPQRPTRGFVIPQDVQETRKMFDDAMGAKPADPMALEPEERFTYTNGKEYVLLERAHRVMRKDGTPFVTARACEASTDERVWLGWPAREIWPSEVAEIAKCVDDDDHFTLFLSRDGEKWKEAGAHSAKVQRVHLHQWIRNGATFTGTAARLTVLDPEGAEEPRWARTVRKGAQIAQNPREDRE